MKANSNKIIKAVALLIAICAVMCACDRTKPDTDRETTEPESSSTAFSTLPPETEPTTTEQTTETMTEPSSAQTTTPAPNKPSAPKPTKPVQTTQSETQTTRPPKETTTRHASALANAFITADQIVSYRLISSEEINEIASEMAEGSEIYYVRLQDGTKTYYMAVDLQTAQAMALSNPHVLRELCRQLDEKQQHMASSDKDYVLMDYTHLVGELEVHYLGYLITGALGAEDGPLSGFYNSCKVADLNVDESRFGPIIDIIGVLYR